MNRIGNTSFSVYLVNAAKTISTCFGIGYLPKAPGTWGSLIALPVAYLTSFWGNTGILASLIILIFIIGIWASNITSRHMDVADPSQIVIDEFVGQWVTLLVVPPNLILYFLGFILFRLFDIFKPWPVSWIDQNIKGGLGIMLDDLFAAIYAAFVLWLINTLLGDFNWG